MNSSRHLAVFAATSGHSGVDRVLRNLIPGFAARGLRVDLLHVRNHGPYLEPVPSNVRIVELGTSHVNTSLLPLVRYLRQERPAALLSDKDKVNRLALLARWLAGVNTRVVVRMGTTVSKNLERRTRLDRFTQYSSIRLFYRHAHNIIVPSQGAAEDLARIARLSVARVRVVPSPAVTPALEAAAKEPPRHPWLVTKDRPVILGVGELSGRKDFATLLRAFALLRAERPCRLVIYGEGSKRESLRRLAVELGVADVVDLPGFTENPYAEMAAADVFALTSVCEGAPVVLMEALGVGTPVVSTDCPSGPREILAGGRYGPLAPIGDAAAVAAGLRQMLDHPTGRALLAEAASPYTLSASTEAYLAALGFRL